MAFWQCWKILDIVQDIGIARLCPKKASFGYRHSQYYRSVSLQYYAIELFSTSVSIVLTMNLKSFHIIPSFTKPYDELMISLLYFVGHSYDKFRVFQIFSNASEPYISWHILFLKGYHFGRSGRRLKILCWFDFTDSFPML